MVYYGPVTKVVFQRKWFDFAAVYNYFQTWKIKFIKYTTYQITNTEIIVHRFAGPTTSITRHIIKGSSDKEAPYVDFYHTDDGLEEIYLSKVEYGYMFETGKIKDPINYVIRLETIAHSKLNIEFTPRASEKYTLLLPNTLEIKKRIKVIPGVYKIIK